MTEWKACLAALQFLTRLPVRVSLDYTNDLFRRSAAYYPIAGLAVGLLVAGSAWLLGRVVPPAPASVLALGVWVAATGALHLDGLMDTADGLLSHRSRERMLEIMKDSRVGAMGVVAGVLLLLLKFALLLTIVPAPDRWLGLLIAAPVWSRWFAVWAIAGWPYAREGQGLGALFAAVTRSEARTATVWAAAVSVAALLACGFPWVAAVGYAVGFAALSGLLGYWLARSMARKLGGLTGDTYGALIELLECALLLAAVAAGSR
ncbi:adenosylcobinamide-GDP ribazoletransferase [Paenibacillus flagellatus]|uniref:Adenosylcobinamide-GDP ribazoletransferase n=2 Tax=Paenibacillus flagellatus TaxID=2211139 RepID=A0A2V5KPV7_9BACL|nr:adenosylcobinamide-GDP ribazoletransferase [Paenibacillus flagellatus]